MTEALTEIAGLELTEASELAEPNSIMLFGHPKRGKTTLAGSIRDVEGFNNVLHIDLERGSAPLAKRWPDIKVIRPNNTTEVGDIINALTASENSLGFDAVILDTISTLGQWYKEEWIAKNHPKSGKMELQGWDDWGDYALQTMWDLHNMYALGISTYHMKVEQNDITKQVWTVPMIQGRARYSVASVPDIVIGLDIAPSGQRALQLVPKATQTTGSRYEDVLGNLTGDANAVTIYDAIRS
jgi:hypothetical protein